MDGQRVMSETKTVYFRMSDMGGYHWTIGSGDAFLEFGKRLAYLGQAYQAIENGMGSKTDVARINEFLKNYNIPYVIKTLDEDGKDD